jgi:hypothetical protein
VVKKLKTGYLHTYVLQAAGISEQNKSIEMG